MNRPALLLPLLLLSACVVPNARYPSLLPRAIEQRDDSEPVRTPAAAAPDASIDKMVTELQARLARSASDFATANLRASPLTAAARGAPVGSDAWLSAQSALAGLDAARGETLAALAEIDQVTIDRAQVGLPPYPSLDAARDTGEAQAIRQAEVIEALQRQLPQG